MSDNSYSIGPTSWSNFRAVCIPALVGSATLYIPIVELYDLIGSITNRDPIIVWNESGLIALPITLSLCAIIVALYIGRVNKNDPQGAKNKPVKQLITASVCLLPFVFLLPFVTYWVVNWHLESTGYNQCINGVWVDPERVPDVPETPPSCRNIRNNRQN